VGDVEPFDLCMHAAALAHEHGRDDLADRLGAAAGRIQRPGAVVVVIGEFKQGKSSLVNGLVGDAVCPVDDDLATSALTVVYQAAEIEVFVHRRVDGEVCTVRVEPDQLVTVVTEQGNPGNELAVERVDVGIPSPLLEHGLTVIDSPGVGGLGAGHTATTLAFLPLADALLFVSDATSELSAPELAFLATAVERCPTVVLCQTKIDLSPEWRRIVDLNGGHLARRGIETTIAAVSSSIRLLALQRGDRDLNDESGFPALLDVIQDIVLGRARTAAVARSLAEAADAAAQLDAVDRAERSFLESPVHLDAVLAEVDAATARLDALRAVGSRWNQVLNEQLSELANDVSFRFRESQRVVAQRSDEMLDGASSGWEAIARGVQTDVAESVAAVYDRLATGLAEVGAAVSAVLAEELDLPRLDIAAGVVIDADWGSAVEQHVGVTKTAASGVGQTIGALKGMQGGIYLIGMLGMLAPAFAVATPVVLGVGSAFGVKALVDQRKKKSTEARQVARVKIRKFLEDVTFRVGNDIAQAARREQGRLRDAVTERVAELHRTVVATAAQATAAAELTTKTRAERLAHLESLMAELADLRESIAAAQA
jgi:hypothetical protein